jgi:hypothetical protein
MDNTQAREKILEAIRIIDEVGKGLYPDNINWKNGPPRKDQLAHALADADNALNVVVTYLVLAMKASLGACIKCGEGLRPITPAERKTYAHELPEELNADLSTAGVCSKGHVQFGTKAAKAGK